MLGKLMKHEWKSIYKVGSLLLLALLVLTAGGCIMLQMPWMRDLYSGDLHLTELQEFVLIYTSVGALVAYIFLVAGVTYGIMIFLGIRFFKTMYSSQGYLTHTLPVTSHQLLFSKIFVSGVWYVLIEIGVILSAAALIFSLVSGVFAAEGLTLRYVFRAILAELSSDSWHIFGDSAVMGFILQFLVYMVLAVLLSPFCVMAQLFGALTIGQLFRKYKGLMGVLIYYGITMITGIVVAVMQMFFSFATVFGAPGAPSAGTGLNMMGSYWGALIVQAAIAVGLYFLSNYIINRKLNLE